MARRRNSSSSSQSTRGKKQQGISPILIVVLGVVAVGLIGALIWWLVSGDKGFQRSTLDKYVELSGESHVLGDGASVYVDMSDGMNFAYASAESKQLLQDVINKLAADKAIKFYGLADEQISPLEMSHTQLYNYMLNPASYDKQKAPIQATLERIVAQKQPALLMSDFEEYNNGVIQQAAYAKKAFIDWLAMGYKITFYKWDFVEKGKNKHLFLAVFDDNADRLTAMVNNALVMRDPNIDMYVLGGHNFRYPTRQVTDETHYMTAKQGGNYHNNNGEDIVTAVIENGDSESFFCYAKPEAGATGKGNFTTLSTLVGARADYYPLGVTWTQALQNMAYTQEEGVYTHLFSNICIDFSAQDGFSIEAVEARVFDMQETMDSIAAMVETGQEVTAEAINRINPKEVRMFLTAAMEPAPQQGPGMMNLLVDFNEKFNGTFTEGHAATNLMRANVVIAKAVPDVEKALRFFGWDGNPSLANSVKEAITAPTSQPDGAILFTYYLKTLAE